jgi:DNA-binding winged helix-turn-helix (wHTH) protein
MAEPPFALCAIIKIRSRREEVVGGFRENSGIFPGGGMRLRFGECVLDGETRELLVGGKPVHVSPKAFELLEILMESRPRALSKSEIHERLWRDTFVSDGTLTSLVAEVRSAIGDTGEETQWIRTVHRFGYAFSGPVEAEEKRSRRRPPSFAYRLFWRSREMALEEGENVIGRDPDVGIFIDHTSVSRRHARIRISGENAVVEDLGSKNGTFLRGERVEAASSLADGDKLRLGSVDLLFRVFPLSGSTETAERESRRKTDGA